jgi:hypothetical protein
LQRQHWRSKVEEYSNWLASHAPSRPGGLKRNDAPKTGGGTVRFGRSSANAATQRVILNLAMAQRGTQNYRSRNAKTPGRNTGFDALCRSKSVPDNRPSTVVGGSGNRIGQENCPSPQRERVATCPFGLSATCLHMGAVTVWQWLSRVDAPPQPAQQPGADNFGCEV